MYTTIEELTNTTGISRRTLQRWFEEMKVPFVSRKSKGSAKVRSYLISAAAKVIKDRKPNMPKRTRTKKAVQ